MSRAEEDKALVRRFFEARVKTDLDALNKMPGECWLRTPPQQRRAPPSPPTAIDLLRALFARSTPRW
jgi:hypothetical protein